ncbi:hypothetical protein [Microbispora sp. NPDC049125]|uniref:hypothetical protein n=1 Tax=Microbispora sp. NPDC049125 TaxID=3154929 RepID=UPI00346691A7
MAAQHYFADTADGYHLDDPSHAAIVVLIDELNYRDNTYMTVKPVGDASEWCVTVTLRLDEIYQADLREAPGRDPVVVTGTDPRSVAQDVIGWLEAHSGVSLAPEP